MDAGPLQQLSRQAGLVLLYHATFESPPTALVTGLHNVRPSILQNQLEQLQSAFTFVDVDTFAALDDSRGYAAVTFDDGYQCVFDQALPVFERLDIPFTVYLNGINFEGGHFWRDKIRLLVNRGWVGEFEAFMQGIAPVPGQSFYRYSKLPPLSSRHVDHELDRFLRFKGVADLPKYCVARLSDLPKHPLIRYGNHSHHHYVLSTLSPDEQHEEITRTREMLQSLGVDRLSRLFSVPFGAEADMDPETGRAVKKAGYAGVLLSRNRACHGSIEVHGVPAIERFMPQDREVFAQDVVGSG